MGEKAFMGRTNRFFKRKKNGFLGGQIREKGFANVCLYSLSHLSISFRVIKPPCGKDL